MLLCTQSSFYFLTQECVSLKICSAFNFYHDHLQNEKNSYVKESLAVSLISQTLPLVLLYVKSIVGGQQGRSKTCFVSCLKPWGTELHKLPPLWQWIEKNKSASFLTNILSLKIWDTKTKSAATSSYCLSVRIISSLGETLASGLIHTAGEGWPVQ